MLDFYLFHNERKTCQTKQHVAIARATCGNLPTNLFDPPRSARSNKRIHILKIESFVSILQPFIPTFVPTSNKLATCTLATYIQPNTPRLQPLIDTKGHLNLTSYTAIFNTIPHLVLHHSSHHCSSFLNHHVINQGILCSKLQTKHESINRKQHGLWRPHQWQQ